jgi:hypothetical protein
MKTKPTHIAYVVTEGRRAGKSAWQEIGALWPHTTGGGFDLVIRDQLSISGRIVITTRKEKAEGGAA